MEMLAIAETRGFDAAGLAPALARRARFLDERDQKILELTGAGRLSRREAALLLGMSHGGVTRRIHRLMQLLGDPLIVALIEDGQFLPDVQREVGLAFFLWQWPIKRIAQKFDLSLYRVRRMLEYVRGWHAANQRRRGQG
jgi:DNA-directed RNA polymerase specialized sigma24 family protein